MPRAKTKIEQSDKPERIAKVMARAGLCSRREAERWIEAGRVKLDGKVLDSPAVTVTAANKITVDGNPLPLKEEAKVWRYHKPPGLLTTHNDPEGRPTIFDALPEDMPRVISVGRLDLSSEGLLLLTNDGELARQLELPASGWLRRYRVRVHGRVDEKILDNLVDGITVDGQRYKSIQATLDRQQGANAWLTVSLIEGKNREIRKVMEHLGWSVSRLIRISYGPFQLGKLAKGEVEEVRGKVLKDQLSGRDREGYAEKSAKSKKAEKLRGSSADKRTPRSIAGRPKKDNRKSAKIDAINEPKKPHANRRRQK